MFLVKMAFYERISHFDLEVPVTYQRNILRATNMPLTDKHWSLNVCQELMGLLILSFKALEILTRYNTQD